MRPRYAEPSGAGPARRGLVGILAGIAAALPALAPAQTFALGLERIGEIIPTGGELAVLAPAAIWYDAARDVLALACPNGHRVVLVDRQGAVGKEIGEDGELRFPRAVAATQDGTLYVASPESESLLVYDRYAAAVGEEARTLSLSTHRGAAAVRPASLFVDADRNVYVADRGNKQVLVLGSDGKVVRTVRDVGEPADVWADRGGTLYVAEPAFGGVRVYDRRGKLVRTVGAAPGREPLRPRALVVDRSGRLWVLEEGGRGLKALDAFGNVLFAMRGEGLFAPVDLAIDAQDTLYVLEEGGSRIAVFRIFGA